MIRDPEALLPSARGLTDELWIAVIGFLYVTGTKVPWPELGPSTGMRRAAYLEIQFARLRKRFGDVVQEESADRAIEALGYAIMLYESFNRPPLYQWVERHLLFPAGLANTLGPMQVRTVVALPDRELVRQGIRIAANAFANAFAELRRDQPEDATRRLRRNVEDGYEEPYTQDFDVQQVRFSDMDSWTQSAVIMRAAAQYNVRSDYGAQVAEIFEWLLEEHYADLDTRI